MLCGVWRKGACQINHWIIAHRAGLTLLGLRILPTELHDTN